MILCLYGLAFLCYLSSAMPLSFNIPLTKDSPCILTQQSHCSFEQHNPLSSKITPSVSHSLITTINQPSRHPRYHHVLPPPQNPRLPTRHHNVNALPAPLHLKFNSRPRRMPEILLFKVSAQYQSLSEV